MASTTTALLGIEIQKRGEKTNTWGEDGLNDALTRLTEAVADVTTLNITGNVTPTATNWVANQARAAVLKLTGSPGATYKVTIPGAKKNYHIHNATDATQNIGTSGGTAAAVRSGQTAFVYCDGTDTFVTDPTLDKIRTAAADVALGNHKITAMADGSAASDGATVGQIAAVVAPYATLAQNYAIKIDDYANGTDNSARSWSIGGTGNGQPAAGDAKSWATSLSVVASGLYGARKYANDASASASAATSSASAAATSEANAAASYDSFDDRYLGAKSSNPTVDNDGNALLTGAIYWNSVANEMRAWSGSAWMVTYNPGTGSVTSFNSRTGAVIPAAGDYAAGDITSGTFALARLPVVSSGVSDATKVVRADDSRLSDSRSPTAHTHPAVDISDASANGRSMITAANYSAMRTLLGLVIGTDVQAYDADLAALAGVTSGADKLPYFTGTATATVTTLSAFARTVIDDSDQNAMRTTLGIGSVASLPETSIAEFIANTSGRGLSTDKVWSAADYVSLTDAATIAVDMSTGINFTVTIGGNRTLGNPTNTKNGQSGVIVVTEDATGGRTLAFGSNWKFAGGTAFNIDTTANRVNVISYIVKDSTTIYATGLAGVR